MTKLIELIKKTFAEWQEDKAPQLAAALTFYTILSIPPLLVLTIGIAGQFADRERAQQTLIMQIQQAMGNDAAEAITAILEVATQPEGLSLATAISLAVLFFGASGVFLQLQDALNTIWDVKPEPKQGFMSTLKKRGVSFLMVVGIGVLLILLLIINSLVNVLDQVLSEILPFPVMWAQMLSYGVSFVMVTVLIALVYKVIPDVKIAWRDVLVGAAITAVLFAIGLVGIGLYMRFSNPTSSYGAASSLIILLIWVYYTSQIIFLGAEFTQVYANQYGSRIQPDDNAVYMPNAQLRNKHTV